MFGSTVLVPLIINQTAGVEVMNIAMALFLFRGWNINLYCNYHCKSMTNKFW
ncbi:hypothetical protein [Spiroplasma kunkelii]|uniref:hypothetical protein n=1 Tax=Spiroplasma kunkelii TaxID=47834 RepID=UPI001F23CABB